MMSFFFTVIFMVKMSDQMDLYYEVHFLISIYVVFTLLSFFGLIMAHKKKYNKGIF